MESKRIFLIIGFIFICLLIGFGIYWFLFRPIVAPPPPPPAPPIEVPPVGLPTTLPRVPTLPPPEIAPFIPSEIAQGELTRTTALTDIPILNPAFDPTAKTVNFYNSADGKFYRVKPDGTLEFLSDRIFYNVSGVIWAPGADKAILEYPDQSKIFYNFTTQTQVSLPRHWQKFSFSPTGEEIAFLSLGLDANQRWLAISSPDGSKTQAIEPLGNNAAKVQVAWSPNNQIIAMGRTGDAMGLDTQEIILVGKHGENFKSLTINGINFKAKWSPDGERILYQAVSKADNWKPRLWTVGANVDSIGQGKNLLPLNTWVDKCAFADAATVFCAVPKELPPGAGLTERIAETIPDDIYKLDIETGAQTRVAIPDGNYSIDNLLVSDDESFLYFTDRVSGQLYKINLK